MPGTVQTPSFRYSGIYYPQILADLLVYLRGNVPELSDEDPEEPGIQLIRAFALAAHLPNVLVDHIALESLLPTARLRESVKSQFRLIGYRLSEAVPALADLILTLASIPTSAAAVPARTLFSTVPTGTDDPIVFETQASKAVDPGNALSRIWEFDASGPTWTDRTAALNLGAGPTVLWGGAAAAGDCLYLGHATNLWNTFRITFGTVGVVSDGDKVAWEYRDDHSSTANPDLVEDIGGGDLRFTLTTFLGARPRTGASVKVRSRITGAEETVVSTWDGISNLATTGLLGGGGSPSTNPEDYIVSAEWRELPDQVASHDSGWTRLDGTFSLPETTVRRWIAGVVNGVEANWARIRVISAGGSTSIVRVRIDTGKQFVKVQAIQGETALDDPAGSSTGLPGQSFQTSRENVIEGTVYVEVDEGAGFVPWTEVENFLSSISSSRHFVLDYDPDGRALVTFGNGTSGAIPLPGTGNIRIGYRHGATANGNVGAGMIVQNRNSLSFVASVSNPRPAAGWRAAEGSTPEDLERVKIAGPASLRAIRRALTTADYEFLATDPAQGFRASDGSSPVARAKGVEEMFGSKTVGLLVVGAGGSAVPVSYLPEIGVYFNGDDVQGIDGVGLVNTEATPVNFDPVPIDVTATVRGGDKGKIESALAAYLNPLAIRDDGTWEHEFDGEIDPSRIIAEIFNADPGRVREVSLAAPAAPISFGASGLPVLGTLAITIV